MLTEVADIQVATSSLSSYILLQWPDIMAVEHELKGANANSGAARAVFYPTVSLTGSVGVILVLI